MIHLFHGFLGSPDDLSFFEELGACQSYDMKFFDEENFICNPDDILIGYSMGGRVALRLAHQLDYQIKKIIILSANPYKLSPDEKEGRLKWEESIKELMINSSPLEFLQYWNNLSLFSHDLPLVNLSGQDLKAWAQTFQRYRLSEQADYIIDLKNHHDKYSWIVGSLDEKYFNIAQASGLKFHSIPRGHRLFHYPQDILALIKKEKIL